MCKRKGWKAEQNQRATKHQRGVPVPIARRRWSMNLTGRHVAHEHDMNMT